VEESQHSIEALRMNVSERGAKEVAVIHGKSEKVFPADFKVRPMAKTMVLLDPPRQGLEPDLTRFISKERGITSFIYVSCDPATFARDLKAILAEGVFRLEEAAPFDMFPRTKHVEIAAFFKSN
jgi:tRNA/tmRNA/rRNA uracil-C5-methylase (TrmA/RlmC/RlmD family)